MKDYELLIKEDYEHFYNPNRLWSMQDIHFYVLVGGRGIGKTTSLLIKAVKNALNKGEQFMYVRRYKAETKKLKGLLSNILGGVSTKSLGDIGSFQYVYKKQVLGYCIPLTQQQSYKSNVFDKVTMIIYDECILKRGGTYRYLDDEVMQFLELVSTIVRLRDNYKVFLIGNNADIANPYFAYFKLPRFDKSYVDNSRSLYAENCPIKEELLQEEQKSALYALTNGTPYGEYHYNNKVLVSTEHSIIDKPSDCSLWMRMAYNSITLVFWEYRMDDGEFGVWVESKDGLIGENTYKYVINGVPNYAFIKDFRNSNRFRFLRDVYWDESMSYDNESTGALVSEIMEELK